MNPTKKQLTELFLREEGDLNPSPETIKKHLWEWWQNPVSPTSLRLTKAGADYLDQTLHLQSYTYKLPKEFEKTSKLFMLLDKHLTTPFFLHGKQSIKFYGEKDSIMLALYGNDLQQYLENFDR